MQTVFAEKTEDRSLDDNRHIGELFFIRMFCTGRMPKERMHRSISQDLTGFCCIWMKLASRMVYYCGKHRSEEIRKEDGILKRERNWSW